MREKALFLKQHYPKDLDENMNKKRFHFIKEEEFQGILILELYRWFSDMKFEKVYPYVDVNVGLASEENCSTEINFFTLKKISSSISQDRLHHISVIYNIKIILHWIV